MLNLLKYDWRRINTLFYSLFAVSIIFQIILLIVDRSYGWWDEFTIGASFALTSTLMQVLLIMIVYNFNASLKSITRRLLPVSAAKEYISHLILPTIYYVVFGIEFYLFIILMNPDFSIPGLNEFVAQINLVEAFISLVFFSIFYSVFSFMMYYMAVAITRLFRTNAKIVIFIAIVIVCSIAYSIVLGLLQSNPEVMHQGNIFVAIDEDFNVTIEWFKFNWFIFIDLALMAIMSFITIYIMKRKLEV